MVENQVFGRAVGGDASLTCSPETQTKIDAKVVEIVREAHTKALQILKENETKLHELAKYLYENETITGEEFMQILQRQDIDSKEPALEVKEE